MIEAICGVFAGLFIGAGLAFLGYFALKCEEKNHALKLELSDKFFSFLLNWKAGVVPVEELQELFDKVDKIIK